MAIDQHPAGRVEAPMPQSIEAIEHVSPAILDTSVTGECQLARFDTAFSPLVASWIPTEQELTWLAPATRWPLTTEKVEGWGHDRANRYLFVTGGDRVPVAYAELNEMPANRRRMWIGHFIVDPRQRGRAFGVRFARALLSRAFMEEGASEVLLVVFPENRRAIRCYQRAGMLATGTERKYFESTGRAYQFLRMEIRRSRFRRLVSDGVYSPRPSIHE